MATEKSRGHRAYQRTLRHAVSYVGIGLHTGRRVSMVVRPGRVDSGILFVRKDLPPGEGVIAARWYNVVATELSTRIGNDRGHEIATVEHLLAALRGCGIDNAIVEVDGPEVPAMDGSAAPFTTMIEQVGTVTETALRRYIAIRRPVRVTDGERFAILTPDDRSRMTVEIDFPGTAIGYQQLCAVLDGDRFAREIAKARTFGFAEQITGLRERGLARGGSLRNAVLVDGDAVVNEEGLRYRDEFVRHKLLDAVGDLALAGAPVLGHFHAYKPGHELNASLLRELFADRRAWSYVTFEPAATAQVGALGVSLPALARLRRKTAD